MGEFSPGASDALKLDFVAIFQNYYFINLLDFLSTYGEKKYRKKPWNFIDVAQNLRSLDFFDKYDGDFSPTAYSED